jgi:hypothetical protein
MFILTLPDLDPAPILPAKYGNPMEIGWKQYEARAADVLPG